MSNDIAAGRWSPTISESSKRGSGGSGRGKRFWRLGRRALPYAYLSPTLVLMIVLMAVPVAMVLGYSFMSNVIVSPDSEFVGASNYVVVLSDAEFWNALRNTMVFAICSVAAHILLGMGFALLLNSDLLGNFSKAVFRSILVLPWLFTVSIIAVLWRMLLNPNGVVNYTLSSLGIIDGQIEWLSNPSTALLAVTFINIWCGYPFYMISLLAGLQGVPVDLYEAARVDGASTVKRFWYVTIPQLRPILISLALLDFIWTSQNFALIWMTTGGGPMNVTEVLSTFTYKLAFGRYQFSLASTSAVVLLAISLVLAFFYSRAQKER